MNNKTIKLEANVENPIYIELPIEIVKLSETLTCLLDDVVEDFCDPIPLLNIGSHELLDRVCNLMSLYFRNIQRLEEEDRLILAENNHKTAVEQSWFTEIVEKLNNKELAALANAVDYLNIQCLIEMICRVIAKRIRGMTPEKIRTSFGRVTV